MRWKSGRSGGAAGLLKEKRREGRHNQLRLAHPASRFCLPIVMPSRPGGSGRNAVRTCGRLAFLVRAARSGRAVVEGPRSSQDGRALTMRHGARRGCEAGMRGIDDGSSSSKQGSARGSANGAWRGGHRCRSSAAMQSAALDEVEQKSDAPGAECRGGRPPRVDI